MAIHMLFQGQVVYAQGLQGEHVVLKLARRESDEARIFQLLLRKQRLEEVRGVVPVLDVIPFRGHFLIILPR